MTLLNAGAGERASIGSRATRRLERARFASVINEACQRASSAYSRCVTIKRLAVLITTVVAVIAASVSVVLLTTDDSGERFDDGRLSFEYPSEWQRAAWPVQSSFEKLVTYLSTEPLRDPCRRTADSVTCGEPLGRLSADGVLVQWSRVGFPDADRRRLTAMPGSWTSVGGRRAKLAVDLLPVCRGLHADRSLYALIPVSPRGNYYALRGCLRGPGLARSERDVHRLLASTRIE